MPRPGETQFVIHGLDADNRVVRATVFIQKLRILVQALEEADRIVNGKASFDYLLPRLESGSVAATVRERQKRVGRVNSGIAMLESTASAIYNGDRNLDHLPESLVKKVQKLGEGVAKKFSHAELGFADNTIIRIDDFMLRQSDQAMKVVALDAEASIPTYYRGIAYGSFDGILKEIDARGTALRGKLILSAGGVEIDCVMNKERVPEARESFDKRVFVEGVAHYDGSQPLPVRIDIGNIKVVKGSPDLLRWRGAFKAESGNDLEEDW